MKLKSLLLSTIFFVFSGVFVSAQYVPFSTNCAGCTPNTGAFNNPGPEQFGLSPQLIVINQNTPVDLDVTFLLPPEYTVGPPVAPIVVTANINRVDLIEIDYAGITGLDATPNSLNFNPQNNRYGCMKICGSTPTAPGNYQITVKVFGEGSAVGQTAGDTLFVDATVIILPPGNPYITTTPPQACEDTATITTAANLNTFNTLFDPNLNPTEFSWLFPDGSTGTGTNPPSVEQFGVGQHVIEMTATTSEYVITQVSGSVQGSWWAGLFDDGALIGGSDADMEVSIVSGGNSGSGGEVGNNNSPSWDFSSNPIALGNQSVTLSFQENDLVGSDNGGLASVTINNGSGSYPFQAFDGGTNTFNGSVTIGTRVILQETYFDTITIHPLVEVITMDSSVACLGDSVLLEATPGFFNYVWFNANGDSIGSGESIMVLESGDYNVQAFATPTALCNNVSESVNVFFEEIIAPTIETAANGGLFVANSNNFDLQWFANGSGNAIPIPGATSDTLDTFNPLNAPFTVEATNSIGCVALSAPFSICVAGTSSSSASTLATGSSVTLTHDGFALNTGFDVAWAISSAADGPVTDMTSLQTAIDNGWVLPSSTDSSLVVDCNALPVDFVNGDYFFTPLSAEVFAIDSIIHQPAVDSACIADAEFCLEISGSDWLILGSSLNFTFPDGSVVNILDELIPPGTLPPTLSLDTLTPALVALIPSILPQGLCFQLNDLFAGDPNGTWSVSAENVGTGTLVVEILDFTSTVLADSCSVISQDQIVQIPGQTGSINGGESGSISFILPPVPSSFPTINSACSVFGEATLLTVECEVGIEEVLVEGSLNLYPNPNNGNFTLKMDLTERAPVNYTIFDAMGRSIFAKDLSEQRGLITENVSIGNMAVGFYVINIQIGETNVQKHFIVK